MWTILKKNYKRLKDLRAISFEMFSKFGVKHYFKKKTSGHS